MDSRRKLVAELLGLSANATGEHIEEAQSPEQDKK